MDHSRRRFNDSLLAITVVNSTDYADEPRPRNTGQRPPEPRLRHGQERSQSHWGSDSPNDSRIDSGSESRSDSWSESGHDSWSESTGDSWNDLRSETGSHSPNDLGNESAGDCGSHSWSDSASDSRSQTRTHSWSETGSQTRSDSWNALRCALRHGARMSGLEGAGRAGGCSKAVSHTVQDRQS
jgi:hypothetical protein